MSPLEMLKLSLEMKKDDDGIFTSINLDFGFGRLYGGQILAQALMCAYDDVEPDRVANSLHGYFLLMGNVNRPVYFKVQTLRRGQSMTVKEVVASQESKDIFIMTVSFKVKEVGITHFPNFQKNFDSFHSLKDEVRDYRELLKDAQPSPNKMLFYESPFVTRSTPLCKETPHRIWVKLREAPPTDMRFSQCLLAYASDAGILSQALYEHGLSFFDPKTKIASLDHAMWFVEPCNWDSWLMFEVSSPYAADWRFFGQGLFYSSTHLLAQVNQEGLVRKK